MELTHEYIKILLLIKAGVKTFRGIQRARGLTGNGIYKQIKNLRKRGLIDLPKHKHNTLSLTEKGYKATRSYCLVKHNSHLDVNEWHEYKEYKEQATCDHQWIQSSILERDFRILIGSWRKCELCGKEQVADYSKGRHGGGWEDKW